MMAIASTCELEVLRVEHGLLVERVTREIEILNAKVDSNLAHHVRSHEHEHAAEQRASALALEALNLRLAGMNEFRQQMLDTESRYATKTTLSATAEKLEAQVAVVVERGRLAEQALVEIRGKLLGVTFAESVDVRFRALERLVWMAVGGLAILSFALNYLRK